MVVNHCEALFDWWVQIKGASPEMVEFVGMKNLINAVKGSVGLRNGKLLFGCEGAKTCSMIAWAGVVACIQVGVKINRHANVPLFLSNTDDIWHMLIRIMNIWIVHF